MWEGEERFHFAALVTKKFIFWKVRFFRLLILIRDSKKMIKMFIRSDPRFPG